MNKNLLSYDAVIKDRMNFIKSGTKNGSDFNYYDTPGQKYFKILFHFENGDVDGQTNNFASGGLLSPTWLAKIKDNYVDVSQMYLYNSAYSYLMLNNELERADLLKDFINLLSNINSESPWYFKEISGLDAALERKIDDMKIEDRKKISIKCEKDAYDDRIGTLMDLYRAIVWSWQMKREVIPSNLRKFDMSIYIFDTMTTPFNIYDNIYEKEYASFTDISSSYQTSYKYIEFHNCEFDYNSAKSALGTLDNSQGLQPEYTIDIYFDDCYEARYNEFLMKEIGDMITWDIIVNTDRTKYDRSDINRTELDKRLNYNENKFFTNAAKQLTSTGLEWVKSKAKRAVLGNLYTYSLTKIGDQISGLMNGNLLKTYDNIKEYVTDSQQRKGKGIHETESINGKNIFDDLKTEINDISGQNIFPSVPKPTINTNLGNLFTANTIVNNL